MTITKKPIKSIKLEKSKVNIRDTILKHATAGKSFLEFSGINKKGISISLKNLSKKTKKKYGVVWLNYNVIYNNDVSEDLQTLPSLLTENGILFVTLRQGQVPWYPRGTAQEVINLFYQMAMKKQLSKMGLATRQFFKEEYVTNTKKKIVFGLKWIKKGKLK